MLKPGTRYRSQVCTTEVIVVRPADITLHCGGHPVVELGADADPTLTLDPTAATGSLVGKRYTDGSGTLEVLVTKAGPGALGDGSALLVVKDAKPLPSSD
ncbi:hypothetical protein EFK50_11375 [Nocardioides marmoriginsengisoli]|uniref:Uncharacterized protein n=1 Tax=Nocardioides marmoriginsengisoli TaxID=661483 RepID=A0A3N0CFX4_9ACTN|nr:hypothetical protein [Nocardioides marmoriginsengisoli]RNL62370.1 hypothetical protein EFK50_11375 [Nocardioides marmoriginsengisoli]